MQVEGTLAKWHDDRGFGFIAPRLGGQEIFVHVSAFPRDGGRPRVGETLWFDIALDERGRKRAVRIARPTRRTAQPEVRRGRDARRGTGRLARTLVSVAVVGGLAVYGYGEVSRRSGARDAMPDREPTAAAIAPQGPAAGARFRCDGRTYCSQMTSCAEATFFLRNCPGVKMDGDGDGIPCEAQWCTGPPAR